MQKNSWNQTPQNRGKIKYDRDSDDENNENDENEQLKQYKRNLNLKNQKLFSS